MDVQTVTSVQAVSDAQAAADAQAEDFPLAHHTVSDDAVTVHGEYCTHVTNNDDASVYDCPACLKRFSKPSGIERHHANNRTCSRWIALGKLAICDRRTWNLDTVRGSEKLRGTLIKSLLDSNPDKPLSCVGCEHRFETNSSMNRHYKTSLVCDRIRALGVIDSLAALV
jgi:hypothetical protein